MSSRGSALASSGLSFINHVPEVSADANSFWPANSTVTHSPGFAVPQTDMGSSRCNTMPSPKMPLSFTPADATPVNPTSSKSRHLIFFIIKTSLGKFERIKMAITWPNRPCGTAT